MAGLGFIQLGWLIQLGRFIQLDGSYPACVIVSCLKDLSRLASYIYLDGYGKEDVEEERIIS